MLNAYVKQLECVSGYKVIGLHEMESTFKMSKRDLDSIEDQQRENIVQAICKMWPCIQKQRVGEPFVWTGEHTLRFGGVRANESLIYLVQYEEHKEVASFYSMLCLLGGNIVSGEVRENDIICLNEEGRHELLAQQKVKLYELVWQEEEHHHSYADEEKLLNAITAGDKESLQAIIDGGFFRHVGITSKSALMHQRNICVVVIALATRAAIQGDVPSKEAYKLSNEFLLKLDTLYVKEQVYLFMIRVLHSFVDLVREEKSKRTKNSYVEQCKLYVAKYYRKKILISDIASHLGLNSSYLSHVFHKETGMTINEYIQKEKIRAAKNLLRNSDIDILSIAHYLSFSSQSYFGSVFRTLTGTTPQKYRDEHKIRELSSESIIS